jgi:hypothetical protein
LSCGAEDDMCDWFRLDDDELCPFIIEL